MGVDRVERINPAMPQSGGICAAEVTKGLQLWRAEIELHNPVGTLLLQQQHAAEAQGLQLTELVFDRLEGGRDAARLGFAFRQGDQLIGAHLGDGAHRAEHELPVAHLTVGRDVEPNADGISLGPGREAGGLVEGRSEKRLPDFTEAKGFTAVAQAGIEAVAQTDPLAHAGRMDPEATTAVPGFNVHGR